MSYSTQTFYYHTYTVLGTKDSKPVITTQPKGMEVSIDSETDNLSLTCKAEGATSYYWEKQNGSIQLDATGENSDTLTLVNLTPSHGGLYRCVACNSCNIKAYSDYAHVSVTGE